MKDGLKYFTFIFSFLLVTLIIKAQNSQAYYLNAYSEIESMLNSSFYDFKKAIILTEKAYLENQFNEDLFHKLIQFYASIGNQIIVSGNIEYTEQDKNIAMAQCAIFTFITDSIPIMINQKQVMSIPFSYNYSDFAGQKDWSNMFVFTLMKTNKGNCHSLPYLYKIIMDELGYKSHLALAPNHIYIKAHNKKVGWYNIELTCGDFPTDAWYAASGYIHTDAIRNGIYMRALTDKETVSMSLIDLAQGYQAKFGIRDGSFIIKCCNTALKHLPE